MFLIEAFLLAATIWLFTLMFFISNATSAITWAFIAGTFILQIILSALLKEDSKRLRYIPPGLWYCYTVFFALIPFFRRSFNLAYLVYDISLAYFLVLIGSVYTVILIIMGLFVRWICGIVRGRHSRE